MSEYNFPFTTPVEPYIDPHYVSSSPAPTMNGSSPSLMDINRPTYQAFPPSPSSSTGSNRVSKAKKGKRVHECEFPGCSKSIEENTQIEPKSTPGSPLAACSNCFSCQSGSGPCTNNQPMYSYSNTSQEPLSSAPLISPQCVTSQMPAGFETIIDQYMRSVLRPDAFLASSQSIPPQSSGTISPSYWSPSIDPQLPPLHSMVRDKSDASGKRKQNKFPADSSLGV
ncbi:hypothetical protein N7481_010576 [Penicillium waksmanii]|uniref:uncharacterized protein n=1 Tax=Penicillium waksmanii TaxID=69791 RepID=UPI00254858B0|nr:uncharacterized protein N7481_010576 [Penicillium waksmanii]KAJ5973366.1 hypothetical protein N7481_010576 [Penicillium waksmanii]